MCNITINCCSDTPSTDGIITSGISDPMTPFSPATSIMGSAAGVTVTCTACTPSSNIQFAPIADINAPLWGTLSYLPAAGSFQILSTSTSDTRRVAWVLIS